ncbi:MULTISPECIES: hypothetical protein [Cellulomonas]|jgi:hypothetical protein|uniref:hypothetical protein n=1 Tax=Cellulomonas TaxID=1707 RepID=UPI00073C4757|nr:MULTISPECIES: hypothetical protein [Cellulomonas]KSW20983.1 hypothetical protein ATM99_14975 [Cellulomonas sp. B6]
MIFFGWGRRGKTAELDPGRVLVRAWAYFHLFWLFRISWPKGYTLATATPDGWAQRAISDEEGRALDPNGATDVNVWWRFGLLLPLIGIVCSVVIASLFPSA